MTVFKTFLKILNKCKVPIIMYTAFLVFFSVFGMKANESVASFEAVKPDIAIINEDESGLITESFIKYLENNAVNKVFEDEEEIPDALFYRDISYVIYIPAHFNDDLLAGKEPSLRIKSTGDYESSLANMLVERYMKVANTYKVLTKGEETLVNNIEETLKSDVKVEVTSKLDTSSLERTSRYYNFLNYCLLAGAIFVICLVMAIFKEEKIDKRTKASSIDYKKYNRQLFTYNALFSISLWAIYVLISIFINKETMLSLHGLLFALNSFVFSLTSLSIAFLLGNIIHNKEAVNGIVNVIALGSSFLCGAFVPMEFLPKSVLNVAHILPSYWYIQSNETIKSLETISLNTVVPLLLNMGILLLFTIVFFILTNVLEKRRKNG